MGKTVAAIFLFMIGASSASLADPFQPGTCTPFVDDGVQRVTLGSDTGVNTNPQPTSMNIPRAVGGLIDGDKMATVDLMFSIKKDGTVTAPKVLCSKPDINGLGMALLAAAPKWHFTAMVWGGQRVDSHAVYRIVIYPDRAMKTPLAFAKAN